MLIADADIGGARVRRVFNSSKLGTKKPGSHLTAEEVLSIAVPNRRALQEAGFIEVYPRSSPPGSREPQKLHRIKVAGGRYEIIKGNKVTPEPVDWEESERIMQASGAREPKSRHRHVRRRDQTGGGRVRWHCLDLNSQS